MPIEPIDSTAAKRNSGIRVAYLLSRYPAISHTFFLKEVLGLRQRGLSIHVASINPPDRKSADLPSIEASEADKTFYVKPSGVARIAISVLSIAIANPAVAFRGMLAAWKLGGLDLKRRAFAIFYLGEALLIGDWMRRNGLPHLHVHFGGPVATVGMLTAQAWRIPWSVTLHGPDEFFDQDEFYLRQKIESASFLICISDFCKSQVLRIASELEDSSVEMIRLGVDCDALQPSNPSTISPESMTGIPLQIVCTGRLVAAKGHRILLEAIAEIVAKGVSVTCTLIGDGPERHSLETLCERTGISSQVRFLGAMAHQPALDEVAKADVFVLASFAEGLPVALMEAMALGVPCVSTTIAAIPELIHDEKNGMLVYPANVAALSAALTRMASDPGLRRTLGRRARATVEEQYNLARNLDLLADLWVRRLS